MVVASFSVIVKVKKMGTSAWNVPYILIIVHLHRLDVKALLYLQRYLLIMLLTNDLSIFFDAIHDFNNQQTILGLT